MRGTLSPLFYVRPVAPTRDRSSISKKWNPFKNSRKEIPRGHCSLNFDFDRAPQDVKIIASSLYKLLKIFRYFILSEKQNKLLQSCSSFCENIWPLKHKLSNCYTQLVLHLSIAPQYVE